jgi:hypothetical protein
VDYPNANYYWKQKSFQKVLLQIRQRTATLLTPHLKERHSSTTQATGDKQIGITIEVGDAY